MKHFLIKKKKGCRQILSKRAMDVMRLFGLDRHDLAEPVVRYIRLNMEPGQICLITGPSGAGKSLLLEGLYDSHRRHERLRLEEIGLEQNISVIDCLEGPVEEAMRNLCRAGLSDVFTMLNSPQHLSEGQKYRYRLMRALLSGKLYLFADEFGSALDQTSAAVLALQVRRVVSERKCIFVAASCRADLETSLQPDILIKMDPSGGTEVFRPHTGMTIGKGKKTKRLPTGRQTDSHIQERTNLIFGRD